MEGFTITRLSKQHHNGAVTYPRFYNALEDVPDNEIGPADLRGLHQINLINVWIIQRHCDTEKIRRMVKIVFAKVWQLEFFLQKILSPERLRLLKCFPRPNRYFG